MAPVISIVVAWRVPLYSFNWYRLSTQNMRRSKSMTDCWRIRNYARLSLSLFLYLFLYLFLSRYNLRSFSLSFLSLYLSPYQSLLIFFVIDLYTHSHIFCSHARIDNKSMHALSLTSSLPTHTQTQRERERERERERARQQTQKYTHTCEYSCDTHGCHWCVVVCSCVLLCVFVCCWWCQCCQCWR